MRVAIIGCGPAGLIAAHTAEREGAEVDIFSLKEKSVIGGAQYLHHKLVDLDGHPEAEMIHMFKVGNQSGYAEKVYGDSSAPVSWSNYAIGPQVAYSLGEVYDLLWGKYEHRVRDYRFRPEDLQGWTTGEEYDYVFSSIPRKAACMDHDRHRFEVQEIILVPMGLTLVPETIIYSGRPSDLWYRTSFLDGEGWTEYSKHSLSEEAIEFCYDNGGRDGIKPLATNCDCHLKDALVPIGRFGTWDKKVLLHSVPFTVSDALAS